MFKKCIRKNVIGSSKHRAGVGGVLWNQKIKGFAKNVGCSFYVNSWVEYFHHYWKSFISYASLCIFNVKTQQHSDNTYLFTVYLRFDDSESTLSLFFSSLFPSEDIQYGKKKCSRGSHQYYRQIHVYWQIWRVKQNKQ